MNIFQLHLEDFLWNHFTDCHKSNCKWCDLQDSIDVTTLDESMNGLALQKEFGNLSAKAMFKKLGWSSPLTSPTTGNKADKGPTTRTNELVEQWKKNNTTPDQKKHRLEKPRRNGESKNKESDSILEEPVGKRKKNWITLLYA